MRGSNGSSGGVVGQRLAPTDRVAEVCGIPAPIGEPAQQWLKTGHPREA
jgi:hypothetical protein